MTDPTRADAAKRSPRRVAGWLLALAAVPVCALLGVFLLEGKLFFLFAVLAMGLMSVPVFLSFERRRPQARELVLLAVMSALAVISRVIFYALPNFKPMLAIVILTGACLGGEAGFITGAAAALISNFFFGQGPSTPFQMFAFGVIGMLAGWLFFRRVKTPRAGGSRGGAGRIPTDAERVRAAAAPWPPRRILALTVYGAFAALVIYGGMMDPVTLLFTGESFSWEALLAVYAAGLPFNLYHTAATVLTLLSATRLMTWILGRMRMKYGLMEPDGP